MTTTLTIVRPTANETDVERSTFDSHLQAKGITVIRVPLAQIAYTKTVDPVLAQALDNPTDDHALVLCSQNAVLSLRPYLQKISERSKKLRQWHANSYCVGEKTLKSWNRILAECDIDPKCSIDRPTAIFGTDHISATLASDKNIQTVTIVQAFAGRNKLFQTLLQANKRVQSFRLYRNIPRWPAAAELDTLFNLCQNSWVLATDQKSISRFSQLMAQRPGANLKLDVSVNKTKALSTSNDTTVKTKITQNVLAISPRIAHHARTLTTGKVVVCDNLRIDSIAKLVNENL